jgi:3-oxoacyl-[acyl-carrier-protein] synthase III
MKNSNSYIEAISYYLPENILTNQALVEQFPEWSVGKVASKVGINSRHVAAEKECASDMAVKAAENLFSEHGIERSSIDFLLFCTQSPDYLLPTTACLIQDRLKLSTSIGALDFNLGCSGFVYGLSLAKGLVISGIANKVLLITAETYTKHIHPKDKGNRTIFGDAATATVISSKGFALIGDFCLGTDGSGSENLIIKTGGLRNPQKANDIIFDDSGNPKSSDFLFMDGSEIFSFTLSAVPELVSQTLKKNSLRKREINLYVFHQANKYMLEFLRKKIKADEECFYYCLENVGNTVSSTIPIALCEARKEGRLNGNVLLAGFGVGYSWGGCVIKID